MTRTLSVFAAAAVLFFTGVALAQDDADCFLCHGDPDVTATAEDGSIRSLYIDDEPFAASVHAGMGCVACHADIAEVPHPPKLAPVNCGNCHSQEEEYANSLHGLALRGGDADAAGCSDCHGAHEIRPVSDPLSVVSPLNLPETCGKCHSDPALVHSHMISVSQPSDSYLKSVHAQEIREGNLDAASCNDCHGTHDLRPAHDPDSPVNRFNIAATCGQCHPEEQTHYELSIHGKALAAGIPDAPTCVDCHGEHDIEGPGATGSNVNRDQVVRQTCPQCHDDERVMEKYGIETMRLASYMDSYHGMASAAGSSVVASCTSCHGVHDILPQDDPQSSIHPANLPNTCSKCHEDAGPNFAMGAVHIMPTSPDQKALGIVRLAYIWLIGLIIGGMTLHNTIMMGRHALRKFRQELRGPDTYKRFNKGQTIGHLVLTVTFTALALSGFALRYPETWWAQLLFPGEAGLAARGIVHRSFAWLLVGLAVVNAVYLIFTRGGRRELRSLMMGFKDLKDAGCNLAYAVGLCKKQPLFDRYSYIEKFEYWGMWWGTLLMIVTGFCMMFVNIFLYYFPKVSLDVIALIHFYEAWLAVLTIVIWHLYYMIFDPHTYPMNWSWITGHITKEDLAERHPLEYERMVESEQEKADESE
jgi:cytochrome b subunit of formate dehydrogenase